MNTTMIARFTAAERVFHWLSVISILVLALTGAFLYLPWPAFAAGEAGETSRLVHRIFAVVFVIAPTLAFVCSPRGFLNDLREALTWKAEDLKALWVLVTRYYWTGQAPDLPPQGKFTAGQKLHILAQWLTCTLLTITGIVLWFGSGAVSVGVLRWSVIVHATSAVVAACFALVHIYLVTTHPLTNQAIAAMTLGTVSGEYARLHHPRWYETLRRQGRA